MLTRHQPFCDPLGRIDQKIKAIKFLRERYNCGLREAKDAVDQCNNDPINAERYLERSGYRSQDGTASDTTTVVCVITGQEYHVQESVSAIKKQMDTGLFLNLMTDTNDGLLLNPVHVVSVRGPSSLSVI